MKKLLSVLLVLAIVLSFATVFAGEEVTPPSDAGQETESVSPTGETQSSPRVDLKKQIVPREEVPDLIDYEVAVAEKYVCRAYWEETSLNEVVFLKADGSLARYVFSFPVKYEADGEVYDKKPELEARETLLANKYRYQLSAQNDTVLYCAENLADGFYFEGEGLQVNLRPITETEYNFLRGHIDADDFVTPIAPGGGFASSFVTYDSVAVTATAQSGLTADSATVSAPVYALSTQGEQAAFVAVQDRLAVVPSYTGFQVQLELAENFAPSTVYFELDPNGLTLIREEDTLILVDRYGDAVGVVGDLLSSRGIAHDVAYDVIALDNGTYLLSATLPRTSGGIYTTSVVPVYDYLLDASIYSSDVECDKNYGASANLWVGYYPYSGYERVLIRPNDWDLLEGTYPNQVVQSAQIVLRDITATAPEAVIECRAFTGSKWTEIGDPDIFPDPQRPTATWENVNGNSMGALCDSNAVSSSIGWTNGYYYSFDITLLAQQWYNGNASWEKGVIFNWQNGTATEMEKCFASTQYSVEAYRPQLLVEYASRSTVEDGVYYMKSGAGNYLAVPGTNALSDTFDLLAQKVTTETNKYPQLWRVKHVQNGYYTIRPYVCTPTAVCNNLPYASLEEAGYSDDMENLESYYLWKIIHTSEGAFYLQSFGDDFYLLDGLAENSSRKLFVGDMYGDDGDSWEFEKTTARTYVAVYDSVTRKRLYSSKIMGNSVPTRYLTENDFKNIGDLELTISVCTEEMIDIYSFSWSVSEAPVASFMDIHKNILAQQEGRSQFSIMIDDAYVPVFDITVLSLLETGNSCLENGAIGKFVQSVPSENSVIQNDFHAGNTQVWNIMPYNGGPYYTIASIDSETFNYYLAAKEDVPKEGVPAEYSLELLPPQTIDNSMLWSISLNIRTGYYVIKPKVPVNSEVVLASIQKNIGNATNGAHLVLKTYGNDLIHEDEWRIYSFRSNGSVNMKVYADNEYVNQHPDYQERISNIMQCVWEFYRLEFGIDISYSAVVNTYTSIADECEEDGGPSNCSCTSECSTHHKSKETFKLQVESLDPAAQALLVFSGHKLCIGSVEQHEPYSGHGFAWAKKYACITTDFSFVQERATAVHEIGHLFESDDHYNIGSVVSTDQANQNIEIDGLDHSRYNSYCLYGEKNGTIEVVEQLLICPGCKQDISDNAARFS